MASGKNEGQRSGVLTQLCRAGAAFITANSASSLKQGSARFSLWIARLGNRSPIPRCRRVYGKYFLIGPAISAAARYGILAGGRMPYGRHRNIQGPAALLLLNF
jgi:hypothetical protein